MIKFWEVAVVAQGACSYGEFAYRVGDDARPRDQRPVTVLIEVEAPRTGRSRSNQRVQALVVK